MDIKEIIEELMIARKSIELLEISVGGLSVNEAMIKSNIKQAEKLDTWIACLEKYLPTHEEITIGKNYEISTPGLNVSSIKNDSSKSVVIIENHAWEKSCTITIKDNAND